MQSTAERQKVTIFVGDIGRHYRSTKRERKIEIEENDNESRSFKYTSIAKVGNRSSRTATKRPSIYRFLKTRVFLHSP